MASLPIFPALIASAATGDYTLAYAIDLGGRQITGKIENCIYRQVCQRQIESSHLILGLVIKGALDQDAGLYLTGKGGCCFF